MDLSTRVVFSVLSKYIQVHVSSKQTIFTQIFSMDLENLQTPFFIREADLKMDFEATRAK